MPLQNSLYPEDEKNFTEADPAPHLLARNCSNIHATLPQLAAAYAGMSLRKERKQTSSTYPQLSVSTCKESRSAQRQR